VDDVRTVVIARAEQALADNEPYGLYDRSGNFRPGSYKCNKFVCDVANAAGARVPLNVDEHGNAWPPLAGTLGNPAVGSWMRRWGGSCHRTRMFRMPAVRNRITAEAMFETIP
jgi:hypothetical protein